MTDFPALVQDLAAASPLLALILLVTATPLLILAAIPLSLPALALALLMPPSSIPENPQPLPSAFGQANETAPL